MADDRRLMHTKKAPASPWLVVFRRNPDGWWPSAKLSARVALYAPSSLWWMIKDALHMLAAGMAMLPINLVAWAAIWVAQVVAGLTGFLVESKGENDAG